MRLSLGNKIKHISLDLWGTLIKSNPEFKKQRAKFIYENYNDNKTMNEIEFIIRDIDLSCNYANEISGLNISAEEMYGLVLYKIFEGKTMTNKIDLNHLMANIEDIFFHYPPILFTEITGTILNQINETTNITMSILSNTAFIKGRLLKIIIHDVLKISNLFKFQLYSDELNLSKPNSLFFDSVYLNTNKFCSNIEKKSIIHVGDNPIADIQGADNYGFKSYLINSNNKSLKDFYQTL